MTTSTPTTPAAIVTGAGSGVGRDTAILLAECGYHVLLVARSADKLDAAAELAREDAAEGVRVETMPADLLDPAAAPRVVERARELFGRVDALCNIAGGAPLLPIEKLTPAITRDCLAINLEAPALLTAACWPLFRQQKSGVVVNVSSMASVDPFPGFAIYAAAKVGLNMLTRCTASEGKRINVTAVAIAPGAIETPMLRQNFNEKVIPADKCLDPVTVAALIRDCVTGTRDFTPGETILLPGP